MYSDKGGSRLPGEWFYSITFILDLEMMMDKI